VPATPPPVPHHPAARPSAWCVDRPSPEEVHVLLLGLDGLAAAVAVELLRCGVLGLNVNDPSPVTGHDVALGGYRPADVGRPRETALRRRLRELDPRCAPVSGPELFPGPLLPATVVLRCDGGGPGPGSAPPEDPWARCGPDPDHPVLTAHRLPGAVVQWPAVPWSRRPCPDCVRATLGRLTDRHHHADAPGHGHAQDRTEVLGAWARPAFWSAVAARLAVDVLALGLGGLWVPRPGEPGPDRPAEGAGPGQVAVLRPPFPAVAEWLEADRGRCLCGLAQE